MICVKETQRFGLPAQLTLSFRQLMKCGGD